MLAVTKSKRDISDKVAMMRIPRVGHDLVVRGELIIRKKKKKEALALSGAQTLRQAVASAFLRRLGDERVMRLVDFVAYEEIHHPN